MPSTTELFLGVRGTRQGAVCPGRPQRKAMCRHPGPQLCPAPCRFGAAWFEFGTSRSHQQRAGAGHGARDWGHGSRQAGRRLWGLPECPSAAWQKVFSGIFPPVPASAEIAVGFGRWRISSHAHGRGAEFKGASPPIFLFWMPKKIPIVSLLPSCSSHPQAPTLILFSALPPSMFFALSLSISWGSTTAQKAEAQHQEQTKLCKGKEESLTKKKQKKQKSPDDLLISSTVFGWLKAGAVTGCGLVPIKWALYVYFTNSILHRGDSSFFPL